MIKKITLHPSRIGCPSLPATMKGIIASLPGVQEVTVRYEERSLDIAYDDGKISPAEIVNAIGKELGLQMKIAEPGASQEGNVSETCPM